jgi:hypothetical protein
LLTILSLWRYTYYFNPSANHTAKVNPRPLPWHYTQVFLLKNYYDVLLRSSGGLLADFTDDGTRESSMGNGN